MRIFRIRESKVKGIATKIEDPNRTVSQGDRISMKYRGTLDHLIAKVITDHSKKGDNVVIEITRVLVYMGIW
jgi:hypothetical protein